MKASALRVTWNRFTPASFTVAVVLTLQSSAAVAETPQQIAAAHFKAGLKLYTQDNFEGARAEFLIAQGVYPRASLLRNLALCELKTNRPLEALLHLRSYLLDPASESREYAKSNLDEAYARTAHVTVHATEGAAVFVDGQAQGTAPLNDPVDFLPGKHVLEARLGDRTLARDVDALAGTSAPVDLRFEDDERAIAARTPLESRSTEPWGTATTAPPREESPTRARNLVSGSLGVIAVTGAVIGTVFFFEAERARADARRLSPGDPALSSLHDEWSSSRLVGWAGVSVGAAFGAGALATFVFWPESSSKSASLRPVWTGTGVGVSGRF